MTREHFVPQCLWADNRPTFTKTVPAHKICNAALSADNEYFRDVLVLKADDNPHPEIVKLRAGAFSRKIDKKPGEVAAMLARAQTFPTINQNGLFIGNQEYLPVDRQRIDRVLYNAMRGVYCLVNKEPMPLDWHWGITRLDEFPDDALIEFCNAMKPEWHTFGDDVFACRYVFNYETGGMQCLLRFYGRYIYAGAAYSAASVELARNQARVG
jgi:hypothetical protein